MKKIIVLSISVCLLFISAAVAQKKTAPMPFTTSGYYDGIEMTSKESGDYGGVSVFLTESDGKLFALVMIAEGARQTPVLVEAKVSGKDMRTIEFAVPSESQTSGFRKFKGVVAATRLTLDEAGSKSILKRECGFLSSSIKLAGGGDYGGLEVFLTDADGQWYALVTEAEGVLKRPVLIPAAVKLGKDYAAESFSFTLPSENGDRKFTGKVTKTGITLTENGATNILKSKCYQ